jgi:hypothetical protein
MQSKGTAMRQASFHPELRDLLDDPITAHLMASDGVAMHDLIALLQTARRRLAAQGQKVGQKAKGRRGAGPSIDVGVGVGVEAIRPRRGA